MSYSFIMDVPVTEQMYREIRDKLGGETPAGLVAHLVLRREGGMRYIDVWESEADWKAFHDTRLFPVVREVHAAYGIEADESRVRREPVDVLDAWVAPAVVPAR